MTPWTIACQAPLSVGFSRQEYWHGLPFPTLADLSDPGIKPTTPASPALAGGFFFFYHWATWEAWYIKCGLISQSLCWVKKSRAIRLYTLNVFQLTWNPEDCATCRGSQTGSCWWTPWPPFQPWELTFSVQSSEKPSVYFFKSRSLEQVAPRGTPFEKLYWPF